MNKKLIIMLSTAVIAAMVLTAFPLHIEPSRNSDWPFVITIGSPVSAQEADYTCDGADDNVQFQAALDALPGAGGQLFVLAGNYTFANNTTVTRAIDHVSIIGVSAAVSFTGDGVTAIFTAGGDGWLFSNIEADSGGLNMGATTDYMWLHVIVDSAYYPLKTDAINIEDHSALHGVGGADTIFPADPGADKYLMWDDDPGQLSWEDGGGIGDMAKATYDTDEDGDIDTAAGGTEWDSSAATGVAYITAGAWGTRSTGISNTYIIIVDDADAANGDIPYFTTSGLAGYNEAEFKSAYNMEAGTDYQAYDAELAAVAGLTSAENKMIYFTGSGTAATADLTAFARSILDDADEASFKATVNLEIGTDVQAYDPELAALAGVASAADKLPYFTGSGTADVTGLSAFTRGFLDDADEATFKATVNLEIGTDVLAYDATLASIADLGTAADKIAYTTGVDTWAETGLTAFARSILDDVDEATFKATVNLEIGTDVLAQQTIGIADNNLLEMDDADAADNDYAKFTANGLEGREYSEVLGDLSGQASATFNWNGQMLSNWGCEYGATLDASPTMGQFFLHTPTGRNILYQYSGSAWVPIMSYGAMTVYVDTSDGTDDLAHGTGVDSDAFATVQYAVDAIPPCFSGDVVININDETYAENVIVKGKSPTGAYDITLQGTLSSQASGTQSANGVAGTGATQGSFTDTGNLDGYANMLCYLDADGDYRIIDSEDDNTATITGTFTSQPLQNENYVIYDWGTAVSGIALAAGQKAIVLQDLYISTEASTEMGADLDIIRCKVTYGNFFFSNQFIDTCYMATSGVRAISAAGGYTLVYKSKVACSNNGGNVVYARDAASVWFQYGSIVDGDAGSGNKATRGLYVFRGASCVTYAVAADGYVRIRMCDTGVVTSNGGQVTSTSTNVYSDNGADETADGASFGYID